MQQIIIAKNDAGQRADKFLTKHLIGLPQSLLYKFLRTKKIKLNGKRCEINTRLNEGDVLTLYISDDFFPPKESSGTHRLSHPALTLSKDEIVYEDDNLIIMDKRAGITVHPHTQEETPQQKDGAELYLVDKMLGYLYKSGSYHPEQENSFCPALCNRLDRNTAGLIIGAKTAEALRVMNQKIKDREIKKLYYCEAEGIFQKKNDILSDFLYKDKDTNRVYIFHSREEAKSRFSIRYDDDIKTVITKYKVMGEQKGRSLLLVDLLTGRTHQIRAHLAYYGHPLVGDGKYGKLSASKVSHPGQALYSYSITFTFTTDAGVLNELNGKTFTGKPQPFMLRYGSVFPCDETK